MTTKLSYSVVYIWSSGLYSLPADLVDSLDLLEELVDEVLSRLVPLPVVGEVCVCSDDDVDEREGGRGVAKTHDIPELGGVGADDPVPEAAALFCLAVTAAVRARSCCDCMSSAI